MVHGRYSRVLSRLRAAYEASLRSEELLRLDEPIAVLDALAQRLMERLAEKDTPAWRAALLDTVTAAQQAQQAGDDAEAARVMAKLEAMIRGGGSEDEALERLASHLDRLARRIEGAWNVRFAASEMVSKKDLTAVLIQFLQLIAAEFGQEVGARIARRLEAEILGPSGFLAPTERFSVIPDTSSPMEDGLTP